MKNCGIGFQPVMNAGESTATAAGTDRPFRPPTLLIREAESVRSVVLAADKPVTIGRSRKCDIRVHDPTSSAQHLRVSAATADGVYAEDLGSTFGTQLDGRALSPHTKTPLPDGARLQIGRDCEVILDDERARWERRLADLLPSGDLEPESTPSATSDVGSAVVLKPTCEAAHSPVDALASEPLRANPPALEVPAPSPPTAPAEPVIEPTTWRSVRLPEQPTSTAACQNAAGAPARTRAVIPLFGIFAVAGVLCVAARIMWAGAAAEFKEPETPAAISIRTAPGAPVGRAKP